MGLVLYGRAGAVPGADSYILLKYIYLYQSVFLAFRVFRPPKEEGFHFFSSSSGWGKIDAFKKY